MITSYKLKTGVGKVTLYANVSLDVIVTGDRKCIIEFDEGVDEDWHLSINFATQYFFRHYGEGIHVKVTYLHTMLVDSSEMTVVYAVLKCLCDAVGFDEQLISLDPFSAAFKILK